jgi:hypothetical protein
MKTTALAVTLAFGLALPLAAYAQTATPATPATPAKPAQTQAATPAKPAAQAQAKIDCTKVENKAKDECKAPVKKP